MIVEVDHPIAGRVKTIGHPVKFSRTPGKGADAAPFLGQHTREILGEMGYDSTQIDALVESCAVIAS